jgi:hypothetical protein
MAKPSAIRYNLFIIHAEADHAWVDQLVTLDLTHPRRAGRAFDRLVRALQGSLPRR